MMEFKSIAIKAFFEKYKNQEKIDLVIDYLNIYYGNKKHIMFNYEQALLKIKPKFIKNKYDGKTETIISFDNGYRIVRLLDKKARLYDSMEMNNCLSDYGEHLGLYSLRDEYNQPHVNFEIKRKKISQIRGFRNSKIAPRYMEYVIKFYEHFNIQLNQFEMEKLGYTREDLLWVQFYKYFDNIQFVSINKQKYIYEENQLSLKLDLDFKSEYLLLYLFRTKQCDPAIIDLVKNGTDIAFSNNFLLKQASMYGRMDWVKLLIDYGADVSDDNNAAIRSAARFGRVEIVKYLMKHGANINVMNGQIKRHAIRDDNQEMLDFFSNGDDSLNLFDFGFLTMVRLKKLLRKIFI